MRAFVAVAIVVGLGAGIAAIASQPTREPGARVAPVPPRLDPSAAQGLPSPRVFSFAGKGERRAATGLAVSEIGLSSSPWLVAVRRDGLIALATDHKLFWVRGGRLRGAGINTRWAQDLAFAPDGSLLVATCGLTSNQPSGVYRVCGMPDTACPRLSSATRVRQVSMFQPTPRSFSPTRAPS
jgi:hypothetical protein